MSKANKNPDPYDPPPTEEDLQTIRGFFEEYGTYGVIEMLAIVLLETTEDFPRDAELAAELDAITGYVRWPESRDRVAP